MWGSQNLESKIQTAGILCSMCLPGAIKLTFAVDSLPANTSIGVTGVTVTEVVVQKGKPEAFS